MTQEQTQSQKQFIIEKLQKCLSSSDLEQQCPLLNNPSAETFVLPVPSSNLTVVSNNQNTNNPFVFHEDSAFQPHNTTNNTTQVVKNNKRRYSINSVASAASTQAQETTHDFEWRNLPNLVNKINSINLSPNQNNNESSSTSLKNTINNNNNNNNITTSSIVQKNFQALNAKMQKNPRLDSNKGWVWHKSIVLPKISVGIKQEAEQNHQKKYFLEDELLNGENKENNFLNNLPTLKMRKSQSSRQNKLRTCIFQIMPCPMESGNCMVKELKGNSKGDLNSSGVYEFSGLKFTATCFTNKVSAIYLIILVYKNGPKNEEPQIVGATLSSPIYVESRKKGHRERHQDVSIFDPFSAKLLEIQSVKMATCQEGTLPVTNDYEGLYNYLKSPRIRYKTFHPVFLFLKFNNIIKLYYNEKTLDVDHNSPSFFQKLQEIIYVKLGQGTKYFPNSTSLNKIPIIIMLKKPEQVEEQEVYQKVFKLLQCLGSKVVKFIQEVSQGIPSSFQEVVYNDNLVHNYEQSYVKMLLLKQKYTKDHNHQDLLPQEDLPDEWKTLYNYQSSFKKSCFHQATLTLSNLNQYEPQNKIRVKTIKKHSLIPENSNNYISHMNNPKLTNNNVNLNYLSDRSEDVSCHQSNQTEENNMKASQESNYSQNNKIWMPIPVRRLSYPPLNANEFNTISPYQMPRDYMAFSFYPGLCMSVQ